MKVLFVGIGGFLGCSLRYLVGELVNKWFDKPWFPYGTLTVNILGCFVIGFLNAIAENHQIFSPNARLLVFVGLLGGFTTYSTFGFQSYHMLRDGHFLPSIANIFVHIVVGLLAVYAGDWLGRLS